MQLEQTRHERINTAKKTKKKGHKTYIPKEQAGKFNYFFKKKNIYTEEEANKTRRKKKVWPWHLEQT